MNAVAERVEPNTAVSIDVASLTPIQMAYQLMANGHDLASVKEMVAFGRELEAHAAEKAFNIAMAKAQKAMSMVKVNATNSQTRSNYATYDQIDRALRPIYTANGFALSFDDGDSPRDEWVRCLCRVTHVAGHTRTYHKDMPADGKGARGNDVMTKTHAVGAAQQYAMRYLLRMIFNVAVGEGDTDGNVPSDVITEQQAMDLSDLLDETANGRPNHRKAFLTFMKVDALADIAAKDYRRAVDAINSTRVQP